MCLFCIDVYRYSDSTVGGGAPATDCTALKNALLNSVMEGNFLCLPNSEAFPVGVKDSSSVNTIPSKLLKRDFHKEIRMIVQYLRENRRKRSDKGAVFRPNKGAIFFGPSGTGKSWAAMAVLVDELKFAEKTGRTVVYFDSVSKGAYVFGKHRCVRIKDLSRGLNSADIPELEVEETLLIYDAMAGGTDQLPIFRCEYLLFSSPNAGNYKQVARSGLLRFICPNWSKEELKELEHGYGDRFPAGEIESRFEQYGGSPRFVVSLDTNSSDVQLKDAKLVLQGKLSLWSDGTAGGPDWPSSLLKAKYNTNETATTPEQAYEKYNEKNVNWEFASPTACDLVLRGYEKLVDNDKKVFETWLKDEPKAAALHGHVFENKIVNLMSSQAEEVEIKALEDNEGADKDQLANLQRELGTIARSEQWVFTPFKEVQHPALTKVGNSYEMSQLGELTNPSVLYRLPPGFPVIDYFNPPNNCFSVNVGNKHLIDLQHVEKLCKVLPLHKQVNFVHVSPSHTYRAMKYCQSFKLPCNFTLLDGTRPKQSVLHKLPAQTIEGLSRIVQFCMRFKSW
jgi:hypothetical protein